VDLYSKALEIDTNNAVYYSNRAFAHIKLEEYGSAVADATQAVQADPSYVKVEYAQYHIQNTFHVSCNNSCACRKFLWLLYCYCHDCGLLHGHLQGYYRRGDANFMLGKFKEALKDFKTVSNLTWPSPFLWWHGQPCS
jgi:tetratricopeptide (TPR) repeat protein